MAETPKKKAKSFSKFIQESAEKIKKLSLEKESWNVTESESSTVKKRRPPPLLLDKEDISRQIKPFGKKASLGGIKTLNLDMKNPF